MIANYETECPECGELIHVGEAIVMQEGSAVHVECAEDPAFIEGQEALPI